MGAHLETLAALSDHDLKVILRLAEDFVAVDEEKGKRQRRNFWLIRCPPAPGILLAELTENRKEMETSATLQNDSCNESINCVSRPVIQASFRPGLATE